MLMPASVSGARLEMEQHPRASAPACEVHGPDAHRVPGLRLKAAALPRLRVGCLRDVPRVAGNFPFELVTYGDSDVVAADRWHACRAVRSRPGDLDRGCPLAVHRGTLDRVVHVARVGLLQRLVDGLSADACGHAVLAEVLLRED